MPWTQGAQGKDFGMVNKNLSIMGSLVSNVKKLAHTVADLQKLQDLQNHLSNSKPPIRLNQTSFLDVGDLYEREKSKPSIVIRGINKEKADEIVDCFDGICEFLSCLESS